MSSKSYQSNVAYSLLPFAAISKFGASPLFCSAAYQISLFTHDITHMLFSSKENVQTGGRARLCHRPATALPTYEAPTLPLLIDHTLLLITSVSNVLIRAYVIYPCHDDIASQHGSDQSQSLRVCQTPL